MTRLYSILSVFFLLLLFMPMSTHAADFTVERAIQHDLILSRSILLSIEARQKAGQEVTTQIARLKALAESIRANHELLVERFAARDEVTANIGETAETRQQEMVDGYMTFLDDYLVTIGYLPDDAVSRSDIMLLKAHFEQILPKRTLPLLGTLPYRHLLQAPKSPLIEPAVVPAYQGGAERAVTEADLAASPESPITLEIAQLAESLHWSPLEIYAWVKNNISSEWYWGLMKGAEETLRQRSGNDADQASLLVALLRAAGFPARFVRGEIEFFPDLSGIKAVTGISDTRELGIFLQKAGIPVEPVIGAGTIANLRVEHIWVEARIPYANYRGVVIDDQGKTWLGLDTHIKMGSTVTYATPEPFPASVDPASLRDAYLTTDHDGTVLEYLRETVEATGANYEDLLKRPTFSPEILELLPNSMQFEQVVVTGEYPQLPAELIQQIRFIANHNDTVLFDGTLPLSSLSNRSLAVTYEPATVDDQEIINSYGGFGNTPSYLVHLRPVLTVAGERTLIGTSGLPVGEDFSLTLELNVPGQIIKETNTLIVGNLTVMGLSAQQAVLPEPKANPTAEELLFSRAMAQIDQWNKTEEELSQLFGVVFTRPLPTFVTVSNMVDVVRLLDMVHGLDWRGVSFDADFRTNFVVGDPEQTKNFMQLSALAGSVLEHRVFEDGFNVASISTARVLGLAGQNGLPPLVLDKSNLESELPGLALPDNISEDITNAVWLGQRVIIPPYESTFEDWLGYGYIKEDPETGEAGYMLAGMIAGGMSALNPDRWPDQPDYADAFTHPFQGEINWNSAEAVELMVLAPSEWQEGEAGKQLPHPLQVIARDAKQRPVAGLFIHFQVLAGGGALSDTLVFTDRNGIASVNLTLGQHISDNPTPWYSSPHSSIVGENLVDVFTVDGLRIKTPIAAFAFPGPPQKFTTEVVGDNPGEILNWSNTIKVTVEDQYGNSVSNVPVTYVMGDAQPRSTCSQSNVSIQQGALVSITDPCMQDKIPLYGECGSKNLSESTWDFGSAAQVILGGIPDADYPITVKAGTLAEQIVTATSRPFGNCDGSSPPQYDLVLKEISLVDQFGNNINAAQVGSTMKMMTRMYFIRELGKTENKVIQCQPSGTDVCPLTIGTQEYRIDTSFTSAAVEFDNQAALADANIGAGYFSLDLFAVGDVAGKRTVNITGTATTMINKVVDSCDNRTTCTYQIVESPPATITITKDIYAVDIELPQKEYIIPVNADGYALVDTLINYTIKPAEYTAGTAMVEIAKINANGDYENFRYLDSERSGNGFVTLARGFRFQPDTEYVARVVLNKGSDAVEIVSNIMPLKPIALDLRADLNQDTIYNEDDPQETMGLGLVVPVNIDDDDSDDIIDLLDGYNGDTFSGTKDDVMETVTVPPEAVIDDDLVKVELKGLPITLSQGKVVLEVISDTPRIRIWANQAKGVDNLLLNTETMNRKVFVLGSTKYPTFDSLPKEIYLEGIAESTSSGDVELITRYVANNGIETEADRLLVTVMNIEMRVDEDRNGKIDFFDPGKFRVVNESKYLFWVNDDFDKKHWEEEGWHEDDDYKSGKTNFEDNVIGYFNNDGFLHGSKRDLEDFAMLQFKVPVWLKGEFGVTYSLKLENVSEGNPGINLFEGVNEIRDYREKDFVANKQILKTKLNTGAITSTDEFDIPRDLIDKNGARAPFIFEGAAQGQGDLVLTVWVNGIPVVKTSVNLELHDIRWFYDKYLVEVQEGTRWEARMQQRYLDIQGGKDAYAYEPDTNEYLLFVHGWNMDGEREKERWTETIFKRLWWLGYHGGVGLFSWQGEKPVPGTIDVLLDPVNFNNSEFKAWQSSAALEDVLGGLKAKGHNVSVLAHSQGNVVMGEALNGYSGVDNLADSYIATQAALSANVYDNSQYLPKAKLRFITHFFKYAVDNTRISLFFLLQKAPVKTPNIYGFYHDGVPPSHPYFNENYTKVGNMYNFYNKNDYALRGVRFELNNAAMKPTRIWPYLFNYSEQAGYYRFKSESILSESLFDPATAIKQELDFTKKEERYQIFSYIAESRVKPLGAMAVGGGFSGKNINLKKEFNFTKRHYSHSRQFRSNLVTERNYWLKVMNVSGFGSSLAEGENQ